MRFFHASLSTVWLTSFVLSLACDGSALAGEVDSSSRVRQADRQLILQTLEKWRDTLADRPKWFVDNTQMQKDYVNFWAEFDLAESIEYYNSSEHFRLRHTLMYQLITAKRWDELVRVASQYEKGSEYALRIWMHVAQAAVDDGDLEVLQLAGRQVEANAAYTESVEGGPPRPTRNFVAARFFVAAARLELLRDQSPTDRAKVQNATHDLWRVAGDFAPPSDFLMISIPHARICRQYAALESWYESELAYSLNNREDQATLPLKELLDRAIHWPHTVTLPEMSEYVANAWVHRQLHAGRFDVVLAYLSNAAGDPLERARLIALTAQQLKDSEKARKCRELGKALIEKESSRTTPQAIGLRSQALAELAIAYQVSNDRDTAMELAKQAMESCDRLTTENTIIYESQYVVTLAIIKLQMDQDQLTSRFQTLVDKQLQISRDLTLHRLKTRGITRLVDLSPFAKNSRPERSGEGTYYGAFLEERNWSQAIKEVVDLAKRNYAAITSLGTIGARSVEDIGLEGTLKWTDAIEDDSVRFRIQFGAIRKAYEGEFTPLKLRDASSPASSAPLIYWPTNGC